MAGKFNKVHWAVCVTLAGFPFGLFLLVTWLFGVGDPRFTALLSSVPSVADLLVDHPVANLRVKVAGYSSYVFIHVILCLCASLYFLVSLCKRARKSSSGVRFQIVFAALFFALVGGAISVLTTSPSVFSDLMVAPFVHFAVFTGLAFKFAHALFDAEGFLHLALLLPTLFGVLAVVFAAAAFNQFVFSQRGYAGDDVVKNFIAAISIVKVQITLLSLVLVSSVITARAFFLILPSLVAPDMKAEFQLYTDFAGAVSMASGLLFTATLFATFAPGAAIILMDIQGKKDSQGRDSLEAVLQHLESSSWVQQMRSILQVVLTVAAPALVSPVLGLLA